MFNEPSPYNGLLGSHGQYQTTHVTTTSDVSYHAVILESFKEAFQIAHLTNKAIQVQNILDISLTFEPHLFFSSQVQERLEVIIFDNAGTRDFIYAVLARLKFNLQVEGSDITDVIEMVANTGPVQPAGLEIDKVHVTEAKLLIANGQKLFNQAYDSHVEDRRICLALYEWGLILFLCNIYIIDLLKFSVELTEQYENKKRNPSS